MNAYDNRFFSALLEQQKERPGQGFESWPQGSSSLFRRFLLSLKQS